MKKEKIRKCEFEVGFNALGMPIFKCLIHGNPKKKYGRLSEICIKRLSKKLERLIK